VLGGVDADVVAAGDAAGADADVAGVATAVAEDGAVGSICRVGEAEDSARARACCGAGAA
jgi:hypothetical protein